MESLTPAAQPHHHHHQTSEKTQRCGGSQFQMPVHYPRFTRADYENMLEWKLDHLLSQYGLPVSGDLHQKRNFAIGCFLWNN